MVPSQTYPPRYWDADAPNWDQIVARPTNPHQFYYLEADLLISSVLGEDMRALELGCGTGGSTSLHSGELADLVATDFSRRMVRRAARRLRSERSLQLAIADAGRLPFRDGSFDAAFSRGVLLSYVENAEAVLAEAYRVLRPGGKIALDAMNRVRAWEPSTSRGFSMVGDVPVYFEYSLRGGKQVRCVHTLMKDSPYMERAEHHETCKRKPRDLARYVTSVERYEARLFEAQDLQKMLEGVGFQDVEFHPLGHLANSLAFENQELGEFVKAHRENLVRLFLELSDHLRLETAWHLFVTARRE